MSLKNIESLMNEIGPAVDQIDSVDAFEGAEWELVLEGGGGIVVAYSEAARKLTFLTNLGQPEEEQRLAVYDTLLSYNGMWQETDGVRFALDGPDGAVLMLFDLFTTDLDAPTLKMVVESLIDRAAVWSAFLQGPAGADAPGADPAAAALRV